MKWCWLEDNTHQAGFHKTICNFVNGRCQPQQSIPSVPVLLRRASIIIKPSIIKQLTDWDDNDRLRKSKLPG